MKTLLLTAADITRLIDMDLALGACESAFRESGLGRSIMPPKVYLYLDQRRGDFRAMPAYVSGAAGCKWVNVHEKNRDRGLPTVMAVVIYNDPGTGFPLAVMDGTQITNYRTGASGGVAAKYLARETARSLGLVGSGAQAQTQLAAVSRLLELDEILVWSPSAGSLRSFVLRNRAVGGKSAGAKLRASTLEEAAACDIICTTTPSREPLVKREWVRPGAHINAVGADAAGKQELEPTILTDAKVVVDDVVQAVHGGEVNVAISSGVYREEQIYAMLGEIVAAKKLGRTRPDEITVFDSTGLAVQDVALARTLYEKAQREGIGQEIDLVGA